MTFSPTSLADFLACRHKTTLELDARAGNREKPMYADPLADVLRKRGEEHERRYVERLRATGLIVEDLHGFKEQDREAPRDDRVARTVSAMHRSADVIVQAPVGNAEWFGYADVLVKVPGPSALGDWHYEAHDTKLARETRAGAILQLCVYTELLGELQGRVPTHFHVVTPAATHTYRFDDVAAYYRLVRSQLLAFVRGSGASAPELTQGLKPLGSVRPPLGSVPSTYPDPVEHCGICRWWEVCNTQRRNDDHIQFVANLGRGHKAELEAHAITTLARLASWEVPPGFKPKHGSRETFARLQDQAALQLTQRETRTPVFKLLPPEPDVAGDGTPLPPRGFRRLPEPSRGDLYLDLEGDPFGRSALGGETGEGSREYLFGLGSIDGHGQFRFRSWWAFNDEDEQRAFEEVMDEIARVIEAQPGAHVYHYAPYEPSTFKRLAGRYATRAEALDDLLRGGRFVDLYAVVREAIRAGVETYSIKSMEPFYGFTREIDLRQAGRERQALEIALESGDHAGISQEIRDAVEGYNRDDVRSTWALQQWLESLRPAGTARPVQQSGEASEAVSERDKRVLDLRARLLADVRSPGALAPGITQGLKPLGSIRQPLGSFPSPFPPHYLMAYLLDWHRREHKAEWWEFFRLRDLDDEALLEERKAVSGLRFEQHLGPVISEKTGKPTKTVIDRYSFPSQDCDVKSGDTLNINDGKAWADVEAIDRLAGTIDVRVGPSRAEARPNAAFAHDVVKAASIEDAIFSIGTAMANGDPPPLAMALLRAEAPPTRRVLDLREAVLAIQGPPGTGKTYSGGVMICDLVAAGRTVGVTANSHAAIANLLKAVRKEAARRGVTVPISHIKNEGEFDDENPVVVGGTAWHWTSDKAAPVDVLFVDEAGQMSLANTLGCTVAARALVLLGDPQQLQQPTKGVHPDGVGVSALHHILGGHKTMPPERGEFLGVTRRLAPSLCSFTSECFYERRLEPFAGLERQMVRGGSRGLRFNGSGLRIVSVEHDGNRNASDEEVEEVVRIVGSLTAPGSEWIDEHGVGRQLTQSDILIVAPYNAQVSRLQDALGPAAHVGTVDRFQGQEAPVVIYSMATSRPEDAPRGLGFLYSLNRFNVATSRARCLCILVANPRLFEPDCQSPLQMQLANAVCRYRELATMSPVS